MMSEIFKHLPSDSEFETIKANLLKEDIKEDELNLEIFKRIKEYSSKKSRDPFFKAFLETQLLNVHIFKY